MLLLGVGPWLSRVGPEFCSVLLCYLSQPPQNEGVNHFQKASMAISESAQAAWQVHEARANASDNFMVALAGASRFILFVNCCCWLWLLVFC